MVKVLSELDVEHFLTPFQYVSQCHFNNFQPSYFIQVQHSYKV